MVASPQQTLTSTAAAVLDTIRSRRSIGRVGPECPSREVIESLLEAATWAPNHHLTEPWRFFVLAGDARAEFGQAMAKALVGTPQTDEQREKFNRTAAKALRAPVIITVASDPQPCTKDVEFEEIAAGSAAVQNLLLAAHAQGLATIWRSGAAAFNDEIKAFFGLPTSAHLVGFVYVGYPNQPSPTRERTSHAVVTQWRGWED